MNPIDAGSCSIQHEQEIFERARIADYSFDIDAHDGHLSQSCRDHIFCRLSCICS